MQQYKSVSELTALIRETLELNFESISVEGEISNFKKHASGHWYFSLKDSGAQISCTMWKGFNNLVFFTPEDGMKIIVNGKISVYPPRGSYQIDVRSMKPSGVGELQAAFERLKNKLAEEGLFDSEFKKPIPVFPSKIGVITGADSAAYRDILNIAQRRYPLAELIIAPTKVQGDGAAELIVKAIESFNKLDDIDTLIIARGGGSLEDLWAFNEEIVARSIFGSKIPIVTGIGHEIDFTIADFVSDLRAPTPSAAIELSTPNKDDLLFLLEEYRDDFEEIILQKISDGSKEVKNILTSYAFRNMENRINNGFQKVDNLYTSFSRSIQLLINNKMQRISLFEKSVENYDIEKTLKKGFTLIKQNGKFVNRAQKFSNTETFQIKFFDDQIEIKNG
ncbi:MAG: exodeoxyribonuclease VII large subunit [Melioribacteraceae bacterium]|nr:exodeoxyribonuclease VII large subunit [Melioribacteraceae bacterium]WKZ70591.1 MAG: exodeoxyribonuclease VII large subunit [Melioribacteraceae bacterium]